jgi:hypothetical protein
VSSATLTLYATASGTLGQINTTGIVASTWSETGVTWNNCPSVAGCTISGTPATFTPNSTSIDAFTVTTMVQAFYTTGNGGFVVKFNTEGSGNQTRSYCSRENTSTSCNSAHAGTDGATLSITWG